MIRLIRHGDSHIRYNEVHWSSKTLAAIRNLTYGSDANKNKTSEGISGTLSGYGFAVGGSGYDEEDRLVNWARSDNNLDQAWNLSLVGDWNSITGNALAQSGTHGPTHEMLTAAGARVSHDVKGNTTSIPSSLRPTASSLSLSWDFDNRLMSADVDNDSTADVFYKWDALGRRVLRDDGTTATVFVHSGQQTIADYTAGTAASSPTYTYVYASYIDEPVMRGGSGGLRYYHRNQQYSITALTNGSGTITERYAYSAYGTPTITDSSGTELTSSADNNRYTYTGREWDSELSLYHYRARMYDSVAGRFCYRDPIGTFGGEQSLYEYNLANPGSLIDPSGLMPFGPTSVEQWLRDQVEGMVDALYDEARGYAESATSTAEGLVDDAISWALSNACPSSGKGCASYEFRKEFVSSDRFKWYVGANAKVCCDCNCMTIDFGAKVSGRLKFKHALRYAHLVVGASGSGGGRYKRCKDGSSSLSCRLSATAYVTARQGPEFELNLPWFGKAKVEIFGESGYYANVARDLSTGQTSRGYGGFARAVGDVGFGRWHHRFAAQYNNNQSENPEFD